METMKTQSFVPVIERYIELARGATSRTDAATLLYGAWFVCGEAPAYETHVRRIRAALEALPGYPFNGIDMGLDWFKTTVARVERDLAALYAAHERADAN